MASSPGGSTNGETKASPVLTRLSLDDLSSNNQIGSITFSGAMSPTSGRGDLFGNAMSQSQSHSQSHSQSLQSSHQALSPTDVHQSVDQTLRKQKRRKQLLAEAAERFNAKPRKGIAWALEMGLIDKEKNQKSPSSNTEQVGDLSPGTPNPISVAKFLHQTAGLDKALVGDYLAEPPDSHPLNTRVRQCYVTLFDFRGMTFDGAMRRFLSGFRLPGEAQKIDRLLEAFADQLYAAYHPEKNKEDNENVSSDATIDSNGSNGSNDVSCLKSAQALFVLCFSTIMLNTDLHNKGVVKKMSLDDFIRNNRGINDGENVPKDFLELLYNNIKYNEIQLKADLGSHGTGHADNIDYDGLLRRQRDVADATFTPASIGRQAQLRLRAGIQERDMFELISSGAYGKYSKRKRACIA